MRDIEVRIERVSVSTITVGVTSAIGGAKPTQAYLAISNGPTIVCEARHLRALEKAVVSALYALGDNDLEDKLEQSVAAAKGDK